MDQNWERLVTVYESQIGRLFVEKKHKDELWYFIGLIHGKDDFYYGMKNVLTGGMLLVSCVVSLEKAGFKRFYHLRGEKCVECEDRFHCRNIKP